MMITERTLRKWRKEALEAKEKSTETDPLEYIISELSSRILRLTQELMDQHLIRRKS